ncbi:hypothetical protein ACSZNU_22125, partial [Aeromonas hydrophila]
TIFSLRLVLNIVPRLPLKLRGAKSLDLQGANLQSQYLKTKKIKWMNFIMIKSYVLAWQGDVNTRKKEIMAPGGDDAR